MCRRSSCSILFNACPSQVVARNVVLKEVGAQALAQLGSSVSLNGVEITPEAIDIEALYERGHMRK